MSDDVDCDGAPDRDIVNRMALEDRDEQYMLDVVAPLVAKLQEGKNFVDGQQFADMVRWFEDDLEDPDEAMELGRIQLFGGLEIIRVKPVTEMTAADIERKTGWSHGAVHRLLSKSGLVPTVKGRRKFYNINALAPFLSLSSNRGEE